MIEPLQLLWFYFLFAELCESSHTFSIEELVSIDSHQPFLDELAMAAQAHKVTDRLTIRNLAMQVLDYPNASFEFIWSEGARRGDASLATSAEVRGVFVITECCWLTDERSLEVRNFWQEHYPNMPTADEVVEKALRNGYTLIASYILPASDWDEYYVPMKARVALLESDADEDLRKALEETKREIIMHENYGDEYGYVGFVLRKKN